MFRPLAVVTGLPAWPMRRGYHALAVPTWERTIRVALGRVGAFLLGRDIASLEAVQQPSSAFGEAAGDRRSA